MSLYLVCTVLIGLMALLLVSHCKYEDGVVGRIGLVIVFIACLVIVWESINGVEYEVNPTTLTIQFGFCAFLIRHVYRFLKWSRTGANDWRKNETNDVSSDVVCPFLTSPRSNGKQRRKRDPDALKSRSGQMQKRRRLCSHAR